MAVWRNGGALFIRIGRARLQRVSKLSQRDGEELRSQMGGLLPYLEFALLGRLL